MNPKHLESLTELETVNPLTLREYCYRDGGPTDWKRNPLTQRDVQKDKIAYYCESCQDRAYFILRTTGRRE